MNPEEHPETGRGRCLTHVGTREHVLDEQSLDVDTLTGSTVSRKVLLKAVEDALSP